MHRAGLPAVPLPTVQGLTLDTTPPGRYDLTCQYLPRCWLSDGGPPDPRN